MAQTENGAYADPGTHADDRAADHRTVALDAVEAGCGHVALTHALLAIEARIEELTCYIARLE